MRSFFFFRSPHNSQRIDANTEALHLPTSVVFLAIHDTQRAFLVSVFFAMVSNAVNTMRFLRSAPNVNGGHTAGVTMTLTKVAMSPRLV